MVATSSSKILGTIYQYTRRYILENLEVYQYSCGTCKSRNEKSEYCAWTTKVGCVCSKSYTVLYLYMPVNIYLHVRQVMTYEDIARIGSAVQFATARHRKSTSTASAPSKNWQLACVSLVTHEAMYAIICHRRAVVWLQVLSALHFDPTDLTSLKTILCCLSQPHAETRTTEPKQAASRFVVFSAPTEVFVSLTWHAFVFRRASCPSNSSQVFCVFIQYVLIICDMHKAYRPIPVAARSEARVCVFSLLGSLVRIPPGGMDVCRECCVLSDTDLCDGPNSRPEKSCRVWCVCVCVCVCDRGTSTMRRLWPTGAIELYKKKRNRACTVLTFRRLTSTVVDVQYR